MWSPGPTSFLQDVSAAMILSEAVYKAVDFGSARAEEAVRILTAMAPAALYLSHLSWWVVEEAMPDCSAK